MALPAFFDPLVNAPKSAKIGLGAVVLVLIGLGAYFLLISPVQTHIAALEAQYASLQNDIAQSRAIVAELDRFRREVVELENRLVVLKEKLPGEKEIPALYRTLSDAAARSGLAVALFQPRPPRARDYYSEIPIVLSGEGGYHQLGEFLERVANVPRVVNVADLKLTGLSKSRFSLRADLTLATYTYRGGAPGATPGPPAPKPPGVK